MNIEFFVEVETIEELKKAYRKLAKKYHPDLTGDQETMKKINNEYDYLMGTLKNQKSEDKTASAHGVNDGFREIIMKIVNLAGIEIEICGSWVWVSGNTKPVKDKLKECGLLWAAKKGMWYWKPADYVRKTKKSMSMDYIRTKYGSERVDNDNRQYSLA